MEALGGPGKPLLLQTGAGGRGGAARRGEQIQGQEEAEMRPAGSSRSRVRTHRVLLCNVLEGPKVVFFNVPESLNQGTSSFCTITEGANVGFCNIPQISEDHTDPHAIYASPTGILTQVRTASFLTWALEVEE